MLFYLLTVFHFYCFCYLQEEKGSSNQAFCNRFTTRVTRLVLPLSESDSRTEVTGILSY